jgi:aminoglycoside phosphotransferase (APT) family kinase protein
MFEVGNDRLVARLAPLPTEPYATFPTFDLARQVYCMRLVREQTHVPVPDVVAFEEDPEWLGTPFLVTRQIPGLVPSDSPPYLATGWMTELSPETLKALEEATIRILASIHTVDCEQDLACFDRPDLGERPLLQQIACQKSYYEWACDGRQVPVIEEAFDAITQTVPAESRRVLNWGDSRIGNIIYQGHEPVAVLDWELASAGPPEVDIAWMVFVHRFFQDRVSGIGMTGFRDFLRRDRVVTLYESHSGYCLDDLRWFEAFAALRFAIILFRMSLRRIAFGWTADTDDADSLTLFAPLLRLVLQELQ